MATSEAAKRVLATRKFINVLDTRMSYLDTGEHSDVAVVFLHGNPAAAYLWRNVIPHVQVNARCLAPDLVGMGHSDKLKDTSKYKMVNHNEYLSAWFDKMSLPKKIVLVIHDWGSLLGFHWANTHRDRVAGIVFMEAMVKPVPGWDHFPAGLREVFQSFRTPEGEELCLQQNIIIEKIFTGAIMRQLTEEEMNEYRKPFTKPGEDRRPMLTFTREVPIVTSGPDANIAMATDYYNWLAQSSDLPKLYINAEPGVFSELLTENIKDFPNLRRISVKGLHFIQEDSPDEIGKNVLEFIKEIKYI